MMNAASAAPNVDGPHEMPPNHCQFLRMPSASASRAVLRAVRLRRVNACHVDSNSYFDDFRGALVAANHFHGRQRRRRRHGLHRHGAPRAALRRAGAGCRAGAALTVPMRPAVLHAGRRGRALVERVAQRELNLAFGARQREALGLLRMTSSVTTVTCIGLPFSASCSMRVPAVSTCTLASTTFDVVSGARLGRARGRDDVDAGAGQHVAGDADHFVDAHRHRAHALGNDRRQARAGFLRRQLRGEDRLVLDDRHDQAAADDLLRLGERALRRLARGKLDDRAGPLSSARRRAADRRRRRRPAGSARSPSSPAGSA